jgi:hypothetical protein
MRVVAHDRSWMDHLAIPVQAMPPTRDRSMWSMSTAGACSTTVCDIET